MLCNGFALPRKENKNGERKQGGYGSTAEHLTSLQYQIKQDKERLEKLQQRIQKEQVKYEPARHISKTLNEIDGMGQKTFTGKMAISKEDYSQLTALAKEGITSRAEIKSLEQNANYYRQKYFDSANALERMKTKCMYCHLELLTRYAYEGYNTVELSKVYGIAQQNISKRILRITKFLKNFKFQGVE